MRGAYDRGMASQPANPILSFTTAKRCVNEGLIVQVRAQKYTERTCKSAVKELALSASNRFVSRYSSLLSIVVTALLGGAATVADWSPRAGAGVTRLYKPRHRKQLAACRDVQSLCPERDVPAVDFETMYRPMLGDRIRVTHRTIAARDWISRRFRPQFRRSIPSGAGRKWCSGHWSGGINH